MICVRHRFVAFFSILSFALSLFPSGQAFGTTSSKNAQPTIDVIEQFVKGRQDSCKENSESTGGIFKSEGDLRRYLECYSTEPGRYDLVEKKYLPLIQVAANAFEIPSTLLACLIFRESRFDINATSRSGARGLGQHLSGTLETINDTISARIPPSATTAARNSLIRERQADIASGKVQKETAQDVKNRKYLETRALMNLQREHWETYFDDLRGRRLHKGTVPRQVNTSALANPAIAIGATAFYLQSILLVFRQRLDDDLRIGNSDLQRPNFDLLLAAAGAYNMGPYIAAKILSPIEPPDRKKWVETLARSNEETASHILSIQNCITSASCKDGKAWKAPIGSHDYSCEPGDVGTARAATGPVNELPKQYRSQQKTAATVVVAKPKVISKPTTSTSNKKKETKK